jgi:hypothetical protein
MFFNFSQLCPLLEDITFCWSYDTPLSTIFYKPANVFKKFSFVHLFDETTKCAYTTATRLLRFLDPLTELEKSSFCKSYVHVRTMDLDIIQHKQLRVALAQGLNHIPLKTTSIAQAIATIMHGFEQLSCILNLEQSGFSMLEAQ